MAIAAALVLVAIAVVVVVKPFSGINGIALPGTSMLESATSVGDEAYLPTPVIAECKGVKIHSAVTANHLTEILIHNASFSYAEPITTKLTEANNDEAIKNHGTGRIASEQPTGDKWMTGDFIRCYRSTNGGPRTSAIDCGGPVGATVYAPVSGTVLLVEKYNLYDNKSYPDYQIHIQPTGHPELDVVLIHLTNVSVKAGDTVTAGTTSMAKIRDVYSYIGNEMQLKDYTAEGDNGNHTHIQVNDVTDKTYHGLDALK